MDLHQRAPEPQERSILIDVLRGLSITLVALGHTNQGLMHRGWWPHPHYGLQLNRFIYAFHMPAFFFVSGIFLCQSVQKRGPARFTREKLRTMIYPYVLWGIVFWEAPRLLGHWMMSQPQTFRSFFVGLSTGAGAWFLPTIFFAVIAGMLLRRIPMPLLFVLSAGVSCFLPATRITFVDRGFSHLPFLVAGMWMGRSYARFEQVPRWLAAPAAAALFLGIGFVTCVKLWSSPLWFLLLGLAGTLMLLLVARCLGRAAGTRTLAWVGAGSVAILLISAFFQGGARELLLGILHTHSVWIQLALPTLMSVTIPPWLYQHRVRLRIGWLFVAPF